MCAYMSFYVLSLLPPSSNSVSSKGMRQSVLFVKAELHSFCLFRMTPITSHNNTFCASSMTSRDTICGQQMATRLSKANREYRRFKLRKPRRFQPFGLVRTVRWSEAQNFGRKTMNQSNLCIVLRRGSIHVPGHA